MATGPNHPERFLDLEEANCDRDSSQVWMLPLPFERTTCFMEGTGRGPQSMLQVSYLLEFYDEYVQAEGALQYGIHTLPELAPHHETIEQDVAAITDYVARLPLQDRLLVSLGGEHTVTAAVVAGLAPARPEPLMLVQIDAHSDLRDVYEGSPWSHGCAIRRCVPHVSQVAQLGIRSFGQEEFDFLNQTETRFDIWTGEAIHRDASQQYLSDLRDLVAGKPVYLTIDVDGFDPSVFPDTGTPYPGGLGWFEGLDIIRTVAKYANVIAFDCVEVSCPDQRALGTAHAAAALVYKTMNAIMLRRGKIRPTPMPSCIRR